MKVNQTVAYKKTKGANLKIAFRGVILSLTDDKLYANIRNQIGDIDFIQTSRLTVV